MASFGGFRSALVAAPVGRTASRVAIYYRAKIDDEIVYFVRSTPSYGPDRIHSLEIVSQEWEVLRGQEGTDAADHAAGAEIVFLLAGRRDGE
jgi:hypothetical protein